jgi:hypothetical protein
VAAPDAMRFLAGGDAERLAAYLCASWAMRPHRVLERLKPIEEPLTGL